MHTYMHAYFSASAHLYVGIYVKKLLVDVSLISHDLSKPLSSLAASVFIHHRDAPTEPGPNTDPGWASRRAARGGGGGIEQLRAKWALGMRGFRLLSWSCLLQLCLSSDVRDVFRGVCSSVQALVWLQNRRAVLCE